MTIKTKVEIYDVKNDDTFEAGSTNDLYEAMFDTNTFCSYKGSVTITTEYGIRNIKCFGNLSAYELNEKDMYGLPVILIIADGGDTE